MRRSNTYQTQVSTCSHVISIQQILQNQLAHILFYLFFLFPPTARGFPAIKVGLLSISKLQGKQDKGKIKGWKSSMSNSLELCTSLLSEHSVNKALRFHNKNPDCLHIPKNFHPPRTSPFSLCKNRLSDPKQTGMC